MSSNPPAGLQLNPAAPDYDTILDQLTTFLTNTNSWNSLLTSSTGNTLLRFISAVGAFAQQAIERSLQENFPSTARLPSSIYRIADLLGVHIQRANPATVPVTITRTPATTIDGIPAYTQFYLNNIAFFNRTAIYFAINQAVVNVTLYQGQIYSQTFTSDGTAFQTFIVGPSNFSLSDQDIYCIINGVTWTRTTDGLWLLNDLAQNFYENTTATGAVQVKFGNGLYGQIPPANTAINFFYTLVSAISDTAVALNTPLSLASYPQFTVANTGSITAYEAAKSAAFYQAMSPALYSSFERAVTRDDNEALIQTYPGVIDNVVLGQAEINPADVRWMNLLGVCILTETVWAPAQWNAFVFWYRSKVGMAALQPVRWDPQPISVNFVINIYCFNRANLNGVQANAASLIQAYYGLKQGSLGGAYHLSDITAQIIDNITDATGNLIDYVDILAPTQAINLKKTQFVLLKNLTVNVAYTARRTMQVLGTINN